MAKRTNRVRTTLRAACCAAALGAGAPALAQLPALHTFLGDREGERTGTDVAWVGDVDGDGVDDLAFGATDGHGYPPLSDIGEAHVVSGADGTVLHTFRSDEVATAFGSAVAGVGDVDGDGTPDVAVGARYDSTAEIFAGAVRVYSGADGSLLLELLGDDEGDRLGYALDGAGDVDGDGRGDLVAGAVFDSDVAFWAGSARVFSGRNGREIHRFDGDAQYDVLGTSVAGCGDVDGDGRPDVIAGAPDSDLGGPNAGLARVYSGRDGALLHEFLGLAGGDDFGRSVAGAGDVDGDGHADLVVGAPEAFGELADGGTATVFSGRTGEVLFTFRGATTNGRFGYAVDGAGDVDGDGTPDVAVGAYFEGGGRGAVHVFSGADGARLAVLRGDSDGEHFGVAVALGGDANGDGLGDLLVGAPGDDTGEPGGGSAHAFAGRLLLETYCTGKPGLACGTPSIGATGVPSATASDGFVVSAGPALGGRFGLLIYGDAGPASVPLDGGTRCVAEPLLRGPVVVAGGAPGSCGGAFAADLNAFAAGALGGHPAAFLTQPGTTVYCQWIGRDTETTGIFLSDALAYVVRP